ncbi:MAG: HD domain-containing protein [Anaerolineae bacterium]|jgi:uncharacterized protein|nr:HD domain-containing protein [Anaerolineae bacterium]
MLITPDEARTWYGEDDSAHDLDHVLRVHALALRIAAAEGADTEIVSAAALLHDVARAEADRLGLCHAEMGAARAREILRDHPAHKVEAVAIAIASHRFRNAAEPPTLEAKVLYDADKLDAIGAIGVARAYAIAGKWNQRLWSPWAEAAHLDAGARDLQNADHTPVREFQVKLSKLRDSLYTPTARAIAESRHQYMVDFFARLEKEVAGEL